MPYASPRSAPATASTTIRSSPRRAPSARCGSAPITSSATGWAAWSMRIPGSPAAITAFPTARIRSKPEDPYPARASSCAQLMREECGLAETPIFMAGGVWFLREWEDWLDNPELGPDRLPVRHAAAADPGEPDLRCLEAAPADARGGRRLPAIASARPASIPRRSTTRSSRSCASARERQVAYSTAPVGEHEWAVSGRCARPHGLSDGRRQAAGRGSGSPRASPRRCARRIRR